ncbi:MAG: FAD-dependent oxidoreductase [Bacteriovoracaceae bacterium]|nr:FAD-dependent oxidoreductase [Bacteriovoracaceae bacterium]
MKKRLAIVGTGMAGMSAAYFLKDDYDISLFEKNDYIGGHTNTVYVKEEGKELPIDTGFMVFNEHTYPLMCKLFKKLAVPYHDTSMSFCVYDANRNFEYNGGSFADLFTQKKNALSPRFWKMLIDIVKFGKGVPKYLSDSSFDGISLGDLIKREKLGEGFTHDYLLPMTAAVWSTPHDEMLRFPARSMVRFLLNHGLTGIDTQHQWKTVEKGSQTYKLKLIESFKNKIQINKEVTAVEQNEKSVVIEFKDKTSETYDMVIMASHADETKRLLKNPTALQREILAPFEYQKNEAWLHTDSSVMPKIKRNWSSWNQVHREDERFTIYYMNMLQPISKKVDYFININGTRFVDEKKVIKKITYHHPVFSTQTEMAQKRIGELNIGKTPIYFCGAWQRYGFHEDALMSSVQLCETLLGRSVL